MPIYVFTLSAAARSSLSFLCFTATPGDCAAESYAGGDGLLSEVCSDSSVEPDGRDAQRSSQFHRVPGPGTVPGGPGGAGAACQMQFRKALIQIVSLIFLFWQTYHGEPSIQQKILGLLVGSDCIETSLLVFPCTVKRY